MYDQTLAQACSAAAPPEMAADGWGEWTVGNWTAVTVLSADSDVTLLVETGKTWSVLAMIGNDRIANAEGPDLGECFAFAYKPLRREMVARGMAKEIECCPCGEPLCPGEDTWNDEE